MRSRRLHRRSKENLIPVAWSSRIARVRDVHVGTKRMAKVNVTFVHLYSLNPILPFTPRIVIPSERFR